MLTAMSQLLIPTWSCSLTEKLELYPLFWFWFYFWIYLAGLCTTLTLCMSQNLEYMSHTHKKDNKYDYFSTARINFEMLVSLFIVLRFGTNFIWTCFSFVLQVAKDVLFFCCLLNWSCSGRDCLITFVNVPKGY